MSNLGDFKRGLAGVAGLQRGELSTVDESIAIYFKYDKAAADGAANTATADTSIFVNPYNFALYVAGAYGVATGAGITQDAANYATITFKTNNGSGGATAVAATLDSLTGSGGTWAQNQTKAAVSVTKANAALAANGGMLWFNIAKAGTGVVVPVSYYIVKMYKAE